LYFLRSCVASYPEVFAGTRPGIEVLYPTGDPHTLARAMEGMVPFSEYDVYVGLLHQAVMARVDRAVDRPLRILEVGGGSGAVTRPLVPLLRGRNVRYMFSDLGKSLVLDMERWARHEGHDIVDVCVFDVTRPWSQQGLEPAAFDVVIGLDVVHATPDVAATVRNLATLLAPEGTLLLLESVNPPRFFDLVFGLAEGWWKLHRHGAAAKLAAVGVGRLGRSFHCRRPAGHGFSAGPRRAQRDGHRAGGRLASRPQPWKTSSWPLRRREARCGSKPLTSPTPPRCAPQSRQSSADSGRSTASSHAAGEMLSGPLTTRERAHVAREFSAKIAGTMALDEALDGRPLDFLLLCSSVAGIAAGPGDAGYAGRQRLPRRLCACLLGRWAPHHFGRMGPLGRRRARAAA